MKTAIFSFSLLWIHCSVSFVIYCGDKKKEKHVFYVDLVFLLVLFQLVLESVKARQQQDSLLMEKRILEREILQANISLDLYNVKAARIEDQVFYFNYILAMELP